MIHYFPPHKTTGAKVIIRGNLPGIGQVLDFIIEGGKFSCIEPEHQENRYEAGGDGFFLCGGFFDPQVNGYGGVDFNGKGLTVDELHRASKALAAAGVTRFFPTLTTASHERMVANLKILARAAEQDPLFRNMCRGIHLEGPYLSPEEGFRGAHPKEFIRPPDWEEVERFQEACGGRIRLITLAPEMNEAIPFIERSVSRGIVIGMAHTNAPEEILEDAFRAGARLSCHLGNGAHTLLPRHRNPIQKQLSMDGLLASIIADGVHLPDYVVKNFIRAKGIDRTLLTTDSMAGAGAPIGRYMIGDLEVEVSADGRSARLPGTPYLAGSTLTMDRAITNVIHFAGIDLPTAVKMAGENAGKLFPDVQGEIRVGSPANLVLFEYQEEVVTQATWIHGEKIWEREKAGPEG
jgi:N-acetylglucosamine-6-phosphate deacetylase